MMRRSTNYTCWVCECAWGVCVLCVLQKYLAASYNSYYISRGIFSIIHKSFLTSLSGDFCLCVTHCVLCVRQKYLAASYNSYYISRGIFSIIHKSFLTSLSGDFCLCVTHCVLCVRQKYLAASYNSYYISHGDLLDNS
jgi:hypothetical protein